MTGLAVNILGSLIAWLVVTLPAFVVHHKLIKRHMTVITSRQSAEIRRITDDQTAALAGPGAGRRSD